MTCQRDLEDSPAVSPPPSFRIEKVTNTKTVLFRQGKITTDEFLIYVIASVSSEASRGFINLPLQQRSRRCRETKIVEKSSVSISRRNLLGHDDWILRHVDESAIDPDWSSVRSDLEKV
ncbi:hypothetical protein AVEN_265059-1 [Araneus ventricosus]|uniref:Uncharacterized protein n=1 Tax=Araneus ventricosus TaxID=182803 RepID=A0A4Y2R3G1_ARAVE|nr:hypothetical protein AVEN_265059-1 [Araneus ventricosus]